MSNPLEHTIVRVTLFEDRAEVVRRARAQLPAGRSRWVVQGVSALLDERSAVVVARGEGAEVLSHQVGRRIAVQPSPAQQQREEIETALEQARARKEGVDAALARVQAGARRLEEQLQRWVTALEAAPRELAERPEDWQATWALLTEQRRAALDQERRLLAEQEQAVSDVTWEEFKLGASAHGVRRLVADLDVELRAAQPTPVEIEWTYQLPCALWRPEHRARLRRSGADHVVDVELVACAWQAVGEDWTEVAVVFSTARPARHAQAPLLGEDVLVSQKKETRTTTVEVREQVVQLAGVPGATRAAAEMPGVDDGGAPLALSAPRPVSLTGDGTPVRVPLKRWSLPAQVETVLMAQRCLAPHLRARLSWAGETPLLAGPLHVSRGHTHVGRSRTRLTHPGEAMELGLGPDDELRARRTVVDKEDRQALTGTYLLQRTVRLSISNLSGVPRPLTVVERIPVSEVADLEILPRLDGGWSLDARDGMLSKKVEVPARGVLVVEYLWELRARPSVVGLAEQIKRM